MTFAFIIYLALESAAAFWMIGRPVRITPRVACCVSAYNMLLVGLLILWEASK